MLTKNILDQVLYERILILIRDELNVVDDCCISVIADHNALACLYAVYSASSCLDVKIKSLRKLS